MPLDHCLWQPSTQLYENFGLGIGEDTYANQLPALGGEANYKQFVNRVKEDNMLNRKVSRRVGAKTARC